VPDSQFGRSGREENVLPLPGFKSRAVQAVAYSLYYHRQW